MRNSITFCLGMLLALAGVTAHAQGQYSTDKWRFSDPKQFGFTVLDMHFYDNNFGIAVGQSGGIAKTTDGGAKWTYGPFSYTSQAGLKVVGSFSDVHVATANVAYAVGGAGLMAKTTDAGKTWSFVTTPLFASARNINTCWFFNKDTGYIAGQWNTPDSLPKLYRTRDGGATWDSLAAPAVSGTTKVGYINNPAYPGIDYNIDAKAKEIYRIQFLNPNLGYICGQGSPLFPTLPVPNITNSTTCAVTTGSVTTGSQSASLLWKFENGTLTDYSVSKERLGYTGYPAVGPFNCIQRYGTVTATSQQFRALNIINDSLIVMMSFNNSIVVRVRTGKNDSTQNINRPGVYEKGKYEILNTGSAGAPVGYPAIPTVPVLTASNPYQMKRAASGKLYAGGGGGFLWTSIDTGRNWKQEYSLPQGRNYSNFSTWALDILPSGKVVTAGMGGVYADSIPGGSFNSTYSWVGSTGNKVDFVDCNNGLVTGSASIAVTTNGGNTWINKDRPDFLNSFYNITGAHYTQLNKMYFAVSNGTIYRSVDQGTTLDPVFSDFNFPMNDVVGVGNDTVYAVGYNSSATAATRKTSIFRSYNNAVTWQAFDVVPASGTTTAAANLSNMTFPSRNFGYVCGTRNGVYKTTNGGTTWTSINPFPALNEAVNGSTFVSYTDISSINDSTVFVVGNMFTTTNVRRVYKTTNYGATWTDISSNINTLLPSGNMLAVLFSDANNGYVAGSNVLFVTNNGGTSWTMEIAPNGNLHNAIGFAPRTVPAAIPFANRKLMVAGFGAGFGTVVTTILEYGDTLNVNINSLTETITNATCTNLSAGSITLNPVGGLPPYSYSINGGAFQTSNTFTGLTQGVKTITIKDIFCGSITKTVTVGFTNNLTVATNNDTLVCAGAPVQLVATSPAGSTFAWTPAAGLSSAIIANPIATVNTNTPFTVTATLGSCTATKIVNVNIKPNPVISAGANQTIVEGDVAQLTGTLTGFASSIAWTPAATLTNANTLTPTATPLLTTTYTLTVRDNNSCTSTANTTVTVIPYCVQPMDAFTPNGDGINDKWVVTKGTGCISTIQVAVYNRYGGQVYKNDNYQNNWDGTYSGKSVADGTYYYQIKYKLVNGNTVSSKGNVTILR